MAKTQFPGGGTALSTVNQIFDQNKLVKWWQLSPSQRFGRNGEQGVDFALPIGTKIGAIAGGLIVHSAYTGIPSIGYVIQVKTATGQLFQYQHMNTSNVRVGQTVGVGDVLGFSGGPADGVYSTGPHIEVRFSQTYNAALNTGTNLSGAFWMDGNWTDPYATFLNLGNTTPIGGVGQLNTTSPQGVSMSVAQAAALAASTGAPSSNAFGASFQLPTVHLGPTADVTSALVGLDTFLQLVNPFYVANVQDINILGVDMGMQNPIAWLEGFGYNVMADLAALIIRLLLILIGAYICWKVINHFIDFGALASNAMEVGKAGLALAAV